MTVTIGSLFTGVGGADLGFLAAGCEVAFMCEIDPYAQSVLRRHFPDTPLYDDVRELRGSALPPVDAILACWPCQDLSVAGNRAGLAGGRSGLFWEIPRIVREMREVTGGRCPTWFVGENVPGLFSSHRGRDFARVLAGFSQCGALDIVWRVLDAQHFGVPQRRRRVFVVADFGGERAADVLLEPESLRGDPPAGGGPQEDAARGAQAGAGGVGGDIAGTLGSRPGNGRGGWNGDTDRMTFVPQAYTLHAYTSTAMAGDGDAQAAFPTDRARTLDTTGGLATYQGGTAIVDERPDVPAIAPTLQANLGHHRRHSGRGDSGDPLVPDIAPTLGTNDSYYRGDAGNPLVPALTPIGTRGDPDGPANSLLSRGNRYDGESQSFVVETLRSHPRPGSNSAGALAFQAYQDPISGTAAPCLDAQGGASVAFAENQQAELRESAYVPNLATRRGGKPGMTYPAVRSGLAVRRLTPLECTRLMGWPDGWVQYGDDGKEIPDTHQYRLVGNGVVAPVAAWIARRLVAVHLELQGADA